MKRELTEQEITLLFDFVRSKYVRFVDIQYEIVDHLASAIEEDLENNPTWSFDQALQNTYDKFPVTGFTNMIRSKEKALSRFWWKKVSQYFLSYYTLPKIILTLCLGVMLFTIYQFVPYGIPIVTISYLLYAFYAMFAFRQRTKFSQEKIDKFMVIQSFNSILLVFAWPMYFIIVFDSRDILLTSMSPYNIYVSIILAIGFSFFFIAAYGMHTAFPKMILKELDTKYAHLKIS